VKQKSSDTSDISSDGTNISLPRKDPQFEQNNSLGAELRKNKPQSGADRE
jgi:hypothetical protein